MNTGERPLDPRRWSEGIAVANPGRVSPIVVRLVRVLVAPVVRLCFRPTLEGTEYLPVDRPYILVANHSGGMGIAEIFCFLALYLGRFGDKRPLAGFALPIGFRVFPLSAALRAIGAIPATYEAAEKTLDAGVPILMFPGGDHETLRPIWQANAVDFGGRLGFLRIARQAGVAIIPMGIAGSHWTAPVLLRSTLLATLLVQPRMIGVRRWGITVLSIAGAAAIVLFVPLAIPWRMALVWLWLGSPLVLLPWIPATIRMCIGPPLQHSEVFGESDDSDDALRRALNRVEAAVKNQMDQARSD